VVEDVVVAEGLYVVVVVHGLGPDPHFVNAGLQSSFGLLPPLGAGQEQFIG